MSTHTPTTPAMLADYLLRTFQLSIPREAIIPGHNAPFDYLCHAFLSDFAPRDTPTLPDPVVWANRGGGKTFLGALATLLDMLFKPGIEVRILGGSMEQSRRMHAHLRRLLDPARRPDLVDECKPVFVARGLSLANGSRVELLSQSQASVRGTRVQKLRCDEVELFKRDIWEAAQLVTMSAECGGVFARGSIECLSTMHLPHGLMFDIIRQARAGSRRLYKWGLVDVLQRCGEQHACTAGHARNGRATSRGVGNDARVQAADCPLLPECGGRAKTLARGHISVSDAIALKSRVSSAAWNSEMLCLRPRRTDSVFPEFDPAQHLVDRDPFLGPCGDPLGVEIVCGMDFGFRSPAVILWASLDAADVLTIHDERHESGVLLSDHIAAILEGRARRVDEGGPPWPVPRWIGVDPAGRNHNEHSGTSSIDMLRKAGLKVLDRKHETLRGLELIRARLRPATPGAPPRLFIHRRCAKLIESMERYHYDAANPDREKPVKDGSDHAADALRYLVQNIDRPAKAVYRTYA